MQRSLITTGMAKRDFGSVKSKISKLRKELGWLWRKPATVDRDRSIQQITKELDEYLLREEVMWRQLSRATEIREGDKNTRYFQQKATWYQKKNSISMLKDESRQWVDKQEDIQSMTTSFFKDLYTRDENVIPQEVLEMLTAKVTPEMNEGLTKEFTEKEISDAMFQIGPLKAPGPNGFPA